MCRPQLSDLSLQHDRDRKKLLAGFHAEKDSWYADREKDMSSLRENLRAEMSAMETRYQDQLDRKTTVWLPGLP